MDQALNLQMLSSAIGELDGLPSASELRRLLAQAEVDAFFAGDEPLSQRLLDVAWTLHQVGTVRPSLHVYDPAQQVQANAVAAHVFDLALRDETIDEGRRLVMAFAAQVSSIRGDRMPNASAIGRRLPGIELSLAMDPGRASLALGSTFLMLDRSKTAQLLRELGRQMDELSGGGYAAAVNVIEGCKTLDRYLRNGDGQDLESARATFEVAVQAETSVRDLDSRWVAAHLIDLCDDLGSSSVWSVLPEGTPPAVGRAMILGAPPVLAMWPPQLALLGDAENSPLRPSVKRTVLTFPTSAGKTLMSQLVVLHHIATQASGVCVVAPSHSLCREIRRGLDHRTWVLRKTIAEDDSFAALSEAAAHVIVMTPERFSSRLRSNETELLDQFGLFIFDEAHLVSDHTRGWNLETAIARLHQLTMESDHKMMLVSAALGGTTSVRTWIGSSDVSTVINTRWRGPRRLHATWTTEEDVASRHVVLPVGRQRKSRTVSDMLGIVRLYVDQGAAIASRQRVVGSIEQVGRQAPRKPPVAQQLLPIVELAALSGPVLTVHSTKQKAERLAKAISDIRNYQIEIPLTRLVGERLGSTHPLVDVLRHRVAYHHAALPVDVQAEIEDAVRVGSIDVICATTTLTEGINLPVRTVIVCDRGYYDGDEFHHIISPAGLLNAAGRAGRAGRETEGWVIVADQNGAPNARAELLRLDLDQDVKSALNTDEAMAELAEYELLLDQTGALVLTNVPKSVDSFLAYCWYLAEASDATSSASRVEDVFEGLRRTLAWHQLGDDVRFRWQRLAVVATDAYESAPSKQRRRWARSGAGLSANAVLDAVGKRIADAAPAMTKDQQADPRAVLELVLSDECLDLLLGLLPERDRRFKKRRYGAVDLVLVDFRGLITDWMRGESLLTLATNYLYEVEDSGDGSYRFEQLSAFLTSVCEHHLPWVVRVLLEWVNEDTAYTLCPTLPAFLHYGVDTTAALVLLTGGVRSRRLAVVVAERVVAEGWSDDQLRGWLASMSMDRWQSEFDAGPSEVADLLHFVRDPAARTSAALLDGNERKIDVSLEDVNAGDGIQLRITYASTTDSPRPIVGRDATGSALVTIGPNDHHDLDLLLKSGFGLTGVLERIGSQERALLLVSADPD